MNHSNGLGSPNADLKDLVIRMRMAGLKPSSCNNRIRALNAYLRWSGRGQKIQKLREPKLVMQTFTPDQIKLLIESDYDPQLKLLIMLLLDTGCRISEAITLKQGDIDPVSGLMTLHGKGGKDRVVPFSIKIEAFSKFIGFPWDRSRALKLVKRQCRALGFEPPRRTLHSARHTFSLYYVRHGGSVFIFKKCWDTVAWLCLVDTANWLLPTSWRPTVALAPTGHFQVIFHPA